MAITVVTPPSSTLLTTTQRFKDELGVTGSTDDTIIGRFIERASSAIEAYCQRKFAQQRIIETMKSSGGTVLLLARYPVVTLHEVEYKSTTVAASKYFLDDAASGILANPTDGWIRTSELDYAIDYTYGYVLPSFSSGTVDLPMDIEQACIEMAKTLYLSRRRDPNLVSEYIPQVYSARYNGSNSLGGALGLPASVISLLEPYRRRRI